MSVLLNQVTTEEPFQLDEALASSCFTLIDWPLCSVLFKNNAHYPWFILVPRRANLTEMSALSPEDGYQLMDEITAISTLLQEKFQPHKINTASLGNIVSQCHIHVVGRYHDDPLWPQGIWQTSEVGVPYAEPDALILDLRSRLSSQPMMKRTV